MYGPQHKPTRKSLFSWLQSLWVNFCFWLRPLMKWILRRTTRLCELQRICYGEPKGASRSLKIEYSLNHTRSELITKALDVLYSKARMGDSNEEVVSYVAYTITKLKRVNLKAHPRFSQYLGESLTYIVAYKTIMSFMEQTRLEPYDKTNPKHEEKLLSLWSLLMPNNPLKSRIGKQWQEIGFQGDDPATDFRGMGMLGLNNLLYFAKSHTSAAQHVLTRSQHPTYGYSFAIVGINISHMAFNLVQDGTARTHFYNCSIPPDEDSYHNFFSHLMFNFDILWRKEKPKDMMEFNRVRQKFEVNIRHELLEHSAFMKCKFVLENV